MPTDHTWWASFNRPLFAALKGSRPATSHPTATWQQTGLKHDLSIYISLHRTWIARTRYMSIIIPRHQLPSRLKYVCGLLSDGTYRGTSLEPRITFRHADFRATIRALLRHQFLMILKDILCLVWQGRSTMHGRFRHTCR
jgi:hypothetical protein